MREECGGFFSKEGREENIWYRYIKRGMILWVWFESCGGIEGLGFGGRGVKCGRELSLFGFIFCKK